MTWLIINLQQLTVCFPSAHSQTSSPVQSKGIQILRLRFPGGVLSGLSGLGNQPYHQGPLYYYYWMHTLTPYCQCIVMCRRDTLLTGQCSGTATLTKACDSPSNSSCSIRWGAPSIIIIINGTWYLTNIHYTFLIVQMAFWLHCYPELYFMKVKKVNKAKSFRVRLAW